MNKPKLSIVVCTYNREIFIQKTLEHLLDQTANFNDYEVLFIDNNSPDQSAKICNDFQEKNPELHLRYFLETNQGHTFARNRGINEAQSDLISFIDDDAFVRQDYVENMIAFFNNHPEAEAIGGKIIPLYESGSEPDWMSPYLLTLVAAIDLGNEPKPFAKNKFPIGANIAFRKTVFETHGLFDVNLGRRGDNLEGGDEKEIIYRIRKAGAQVVYAPNVVVDHFIPQKRVEMDYIKRMGTGVGRHERKRIKKEGFRGILEKTAQETFKVGATLLLYFYYLLTGKPAKGKTLVNFRFWVLQGLIANK